MSWLGGFGQTGRSKQRLIVTQCVTGLAFCVPLLYNAPQISHIAPVFMTQVIVNQAVLR
jgi:hypothetical protein